MKYEWDEAKRKANVIKHGVDFAITDDFEWDVATHEPDIRKPEQISQADWDAVNVPDMGDTPFQGIKTDGRRPADIAAAIKRRGKKQPKYQPQ